MPVPFPRRNWTVLVYMGADDDHDATMVRSAFTDIEEMRNVGSSDHLNVAVQMDLRLFQPVRFLIRPDGTLDDRKKQDLGVLRESSTGRPRTLEKFLEWARTTVPAEHYLLILWGHGLGVGFTVEEADSLADVVYDAEDGLTVRELAGVLRRFRRANRGRPLDVLGFDACYMSTIEMGYEYRDVVQFIVGSQIVIPFEGWPYERVLRSLRAHPRTTQEALASKLVRAFVTSYPRRTTVTQTAFRPSAAGAVKSAIDGLTAALERATGNRSEVAKIRRAFRGTKFLDARQFVDLRDLCRRLATISRDPQVKKAAQATAVLLQKRPQGFIAEHRAKGPRAERLNGASVYVRWLKARRPNYNVRLELKGYRRLQFVNETGWQDFNDRLPKLAPRDVVS
jgi:hypothetical protein